MRAAPARTAITSFVLFRSFLETPLHCDAQRDGADGQRGAGTLRGAGGTVLMGERGFGGARNGSFTLPALRT